MSDAINEKKKQKRSLSCLTPVNKKNKTKPRIKRKTLFLLFESLDFNFVLNESNTAL